MAKQILLPYVRFEDSRAVRKTMFCSSALKMDASHFSETLAYADESTQRQSRKKHHQR
jgi:hypothetical protein